MLPIKQQVQEAANAVRKAWHTVDSRAKAQVEELPRAVITTGSGLGAIASKVAQPTFEISYEDIPHLPPARVPGHAGRLIIGTYADTGKKVVILSGRVHGYEGHSPLTQVLPLLIANELCIGANDTGGSTGVGPTDSCLTSYPLAIFTNAAGAINEHFSEGQLMLIKDHINFTGETLLNLNSEQDFGGTNLDMTFAYTPAYRDLMKEIAQTRGVDLAEGIYLGVKGAMFETPAEIRAFRIWGADAVGMSTVHEVVAASRLGMPVVGVSVISNMAAGIKAQKLTLQEVLDNTASAANTLGELIADMLRQV